MNIRLVHVGIFLADLKATIAQLNDRFLPTALNGAFTEKVDTLNQLSWLKVVSDLVIDDDGLVEVHHGLLHLSLQDLTALLAIFLDVRLFGLGLLTLYRHELVTGVSSHLPHQGEN